MAYSRWRDLSVMIGSWVHLGFVINKAEITLYLRYLTVLVRHGYAVRFNSKIFVKEKKEYKKLYDEPWTFNQWNQIKLATFYCIKSRGKWKIKSLMSSIYFYWNVGWNCDFNHFISNSFLQPYVTASLANNNEPNSLEGIYNLSIGERRNFNHFYISKQ